MLAKQIASPSLSGYPMLFFRAAHHASPARTRASELLEAIETIEEMRGHVGGGEQERQRFWRSGSPPTTVGSICLFTKPPLEALVYAERAKGRVLLDVLQNGRISIHKARLARSNDANRDEG